MTTGTNPGSLESRIGLYWLNRLGVGSLVVGLALALLLSFFTLPAILKIGTGFFCAGLLLVAGEHLIRKTSLTWYGQGLIGGGWSLAFFCAFVAHHIPDLRVIASPAVDSLLLLAISAGSMMHAVKRRSQTIAALVGLLGSFTICLTQFSFFTAAAFAVLHAGICVAAVKMRWSTLLVTGSLGFYGSYLLGGSPWAAWHWSTSIFGCCALLVPGWFMYNLVLPFFSERESRETKALIAVSCINAAGLIFCMLHAINAYAPEFRSPFLFATATIYALSLWAITKRNLPTISTINQLLALSLATIAVSDNLSGVWLGTFWVVEAALLTYLGLRYEIKEFRWFSAVVAPYAFFHLLCVDFQEQLFPSVFHVQTLVHTNRPVLLATTALASFSFAAAMHRLARFNPVQGRLEREAYFYLYISLAAALVAILPLLGIAEAWQAALWICGGSVLVWLGLRLPDAYVRTTGYINFIPALSALIAGAPDWAWLPTLTSAAALCAVGRKYRIDTVAGWAFTLTSVVLLSLLMWFHFAASWLSVFFAGEGLLLVTTGFYLTERAFRIFGLLSFGILVVRLLILALTRPDSVNTVLTFFTAGAVLLAVSWLYAWLSALEARALAQSTHPSEPAPVAGGDDLQNLPAI